MVYKQLSDVGRGGGDAHGSACPVHAGTVGPAFAWLEEERVEVAPLNC
jgi:hypothetical protein